MTKKLKTFGWGDGRKEWIVAATTKKSAAESFGITMHEFRNYAHETGNDDEIELATSEPGKVFRSPICLFKGKEYNSRFDE
jgi:hypothetical protein